MKKLIFLLFMAVVFAGIVSAGETRSGGICGVETYSEETQPFGVSFQAAMSEFGVEIILAVTPDTALADVTLCAEVYAGSISYEMAEVYTLKRPINTSGLALAALPDYPLRQ
jgi:hypothetical protein